MLSCCIYGFFGGFYDRWDGVGIRFKGFYGSLRQCLQSYPGSVQCSKLSYKLKFDHVDENQRFFGLKRLQLHASITDPTMVRERLTYVHRVLILAHHRS